MPDLLTALRAVLPPGLALAEAPENPALMPGEVLVRAVPRRLAEFTAGRAAARIAMAALGAPPQAVPMGSDRAPQWPPGLTGSITHCDGICLALMGLARDWRGLGLDAEPRHPFDPALTPAILAPGEEGDPLAAFVAKEAAYKAQYPLTRQVFDFHTLRLTWQGDAFTARYTRAIGPMPAGAALQGRLVRTAGHLAALVALS